jgi:2-iminobutanoate/2-iminopropanoate deaminase
MAGGKRALMAVFKPAKLKSVSEMQEMFRGSYPVFRDMESVQFKSWWIDEENGEWGAFYLFDTEESLRRYVESERWLKVVPEKYGCVPQWRAVEPGPILSKIKVTNALGKIDADACGKWPVKVETKSAPAAIGPYSQGVRAGDFLFVSGQIALDPETGEMVGGSIREQTERVLDNLSAILEAAGLGLGSVVRADVFLKDMRDFKVMNEVYERRFGSGVKPARQAVGVGELPRGALVEISCIAFAGR